MGRPPQLFCWDNVWKLTEKKWKCKHCNEMFKGSASRIREHLAREGKDIRPCKAVPAHIRDKASKIDPKKKPQSSSLRPGGEQEYAADSLVNFFMSENLPVDAVKNPHLREFLFKADQNGFPPSLLRGDLVGIQKSVGNVKHEVNEYMLMVKEFWKTTGCTLIEYNLNKWRGNPSDLGSDNVVFGFYCPKGFIFVEGRQLHAPQRFKHFFKNHVLNLPIENVTHEIHHSGHPVCELSEELDHEGLPIRISDDYRPFTIYCVRREVLQLWGSICRETEWVHNLIQKSERLYQYMCNSDESYLCKGWGKLVDETDADAMPRCSFTRLRSIMQLQDRIKAWLSGFSMHSISLVDLDVQEIINNNEFWSDGKEILEALTPLFRIIDVGDSLVPTAGYLRVAIDEVKHGLKPYYDQNASKYLTIWKSLDSLTLDHKVAAYLSPVYDWRGIEGSLDPVAIIKEIADSCFMDGVDEEEKDKLVSESEVYRHNNPFPKLSPEARKVAHPVTLWNEYGDEFPVLRKCAIKMLSQPGSCMCNQVKKYITHFQGGDNFILRLNYHMWQEFMKLGDRIYKPFSFFEDADHVSSSKRKYSTDYPGNLSSSRAFIDRFSEGSSRYSRSKGMDLCQEPIIDWWDSLFQKKNLIPEDGVGGLIDIDDWNWLYSDAGGFSDTTGGVGSNASGFSSDVGSDAGGSNHCGSPAPWRDA